MEQTKKHWLGKLALLKDEKGLTLIELMVVVALIAILAACGAVIRIPMRGFVPSYNLQGAVAAVASERLRQLDGNPR